MADAVKSLADAQNRPGTAVAIAPEKPHSKIPVILGAAVSALALLGAVWGILIYTISSELTKALVEPERSITTLQEEVKYLRRDVDELRATAANRQAKSLSELPTNALVRQLPAVTDLLATARRQDVKIEAETIETLRRNLLQIPSKPAGFWPAASELISYQSVRAKGANSLTANLPNCTDSGPTQMKITAVIDPKTARIARGVYENCRFVLDSDRDDQRLNSFLTGSTPEITFKNCLIIYGGGSVNLKLDWINVNNGHVRINVGGKHRADDGTLEGPPLEFLNCIFVFSIRDTPPPSGQRTTEILLTQAGTSLGLPFQPRTVDSN